VDIVYLPLSKGKLVATKNKVLESINEPYAFYTDDDYVFEYDYLDTLIKILDARNDIDCISGTGASVIEIPIGQVGAEPLDERQKYKFCWIDENSVLHWDIKLQRVDYPRENKIVEIEALHEQFMFRMDRWNLPLDEFFDQGNFYLNETEWTYREFRCAFTPMVRCYHLHDEHSLTRKREKYINCMNKATYYFAKKHLGIEIKGIHWKPKFWQELELMKTNDAKIPNLNLIKHSKNEIVPPIDKRELYNLAQNYWHQVWGHVKKLKIIHSEIIGNFVLVRCQDDSRSKDFLFEYSKGMLMLKSIGKASYGKRIYFR
jgi:hypothetical protein